MTASLQPFSAAERLSRHAASALLAVAVQALLVAALLLWAVPPLPWPRAQKEIFFRLVPTAPPAQPPPPVRIIGSARVRKPVASAPPAAPSVAASPSGIAGFGQSLFGCAPEYYANPAPDTRAHCMTKRDSSEKQRKLAAVSTIITSNWTNISFSPVRRRVRDCDRLPP